jgi:hypothetical protein
MVQQVEQVKRLTAGVHFNSNEIWIGETALQRVRAQHEKKQAEQIKKEGKKADEQRERRKKSWTYVPLIVQRINGPRPISK